MIPLYANFAPASFTKAAIEEHMNPDRTCLSSISPPSLPFTVQTADGSSLSVVGQETLLSPSFRVPAVSCVPKLTMQLISAG